MTFLCKKHQKPEILCMHYYLFLRKGLIHAIPQERVNSCKAA
jgi:hypothetical protein